METTVQEIMVVAADGFVFVSFSFLFFLNFFSVICQQLLRLKMIRWMWLGLTSLYFDVVRVGSLDGSAVVGGYCW